MQPYTIYWTSVQLENKKYDAMTNSLFPVKVFIPVGFMSAFSHSGAHIIIIIITKKTREKFATDQKNSLQR